MIITLQDGRQMEVFVGSKVITRPGTLTTTGPWLVTGFEGNMPMIDISGTPTGCDPGIIDEVCALPYSGVVVDLGGGQTVTVSSTIAPALQAVVDSNAALIAQIAAISSGTALGDAQAALATKQAELDAANAQLDTLKADREGLQAARAALDDVLNDIPSA